MDARPEDLEPLLGLLRHGGTIDPLLGHPDSAKGYCRFVREGAVAVAWDGGVSPCIALMHSYTCYILGREKAIRRYVVGNVNDEAITRIWAARGVPPFPGAGGRVRLFALRRLRRLPVCRIERGGLLRQRVPRRVGTACGRGGSSSAPEEALSVQMQTWSESTNRSTRLDSTVNTR